MCVIIYLPIGAKMDYKDLRDAFTYNPDGAGIGWIKDGFVSYTKGYDDFADFLKNTTDIIEDTSIERVIHFRITTKGITSKVQCHPFLYTNNADDTGLLDYTGKDTILFMNGTIRNQKLITGLNDTASFIVNDLYDSSLDFNNKKDLKIIKSLTNSKWVIMSTDGVKLVGDFNFVNGIYYSNTRHMWNYNNTPEKIYDNTYEGIYDDTYKSIYDDCDDYDDTDEYKYTLIDLLEDYNDAELDDMVDDTPKSENWFDGTLNNIKRL